MDTTEFERALTADGYVAVTKQMVPDTAIADQRYSQDARSGSSGSFTVMAFATTILWRSGSRSDGRKWRPCSLRWAPCRALCSALRWGCCGPG